MIVAFTKAVDTYHGAAPIRQAPPHLKLITPGSEDVLWAFVVPWALWLLSLPRHLAQ